MTYIYMMNLIIFPDVCGSKATDKQKLSQSASIFNANVNIVIHQFMMS